MPLSWSRPGVDLQALLLDAVLQAVIATDVAGHILYWNAYAEELYGWTAQEVLGRLVYEVIPTESTVDQAAEIMQALARGKTWQGQFPVRRRDGSEFLAFVVDSPIMDGDDLVGVVGVSSDVTEAAAMARTLRESEQFTDRLIDSLFVFIGLLDLEGTVLRTNRAPLVAGGLVPEDVLGKAFWDCAWWNHSPGVQAQLKAAVARAAGAELVRYDVQVRMAGDTLMWIDFQLAPLRDETGRTTHLVASGMDVTDRREAEVALAESEARFKAMADELPLIVWLHRADGHQEFVNQTYCDYFGTSREEMAADRWTVLTSPDTGPAYLAEFVRCNTERRPFHALVQVRRGDGRWRWLESWGRPRFAADGTYLGMLGTSLDVTERLEHEEEQRRREEGERRAREQAELLNLVMTELEGVESVRGRAQRLVDLLVPRIADAASVEAADTDGRWSLTAGVEPDPGQGSAGRLQVPMHLGRREPGTLTFLRGPGRPGFTDEEAAMAGMIADRAGLLLGNAYLYQQEHRASLWLQRSLLPAGTVVHPTLSLAATYAAGTSALAVGGDWYDSIALPDGCIAVTVGDVGGHDLEAASVMGRLRGALGVLAPLCTGPAEVLTRLDEVVLAQRLTEFTTACYAVVDPATGLLLHGSAGHPPILLVPEAGEPQWLEEATSMPLSRWGGDDRTQARRFLAPGTTLVLYSDGLVERRGSGLDGMELLRRSAGALRELPVEQLCPALLDAVLSQAPPGDDDIVLLCLRLEPAARRRFHRRLLSRPVHLAPLRASLQAWMHQAGLPETLQADILIAVGEAAANSLEHAYREHPYGHIEVDLELQTDQAVLTLRDEGTWRPTRPSPNRGRGTSLMRGVSDRFHRTGDHTGTTVECRFRLPG